MNLIVNKQLDRAQKQVIYELTLKKRQSKKSTMSEKHRLARQQLARELMQERLHPFQHNWPTIYQDEESETTTTTMTTTTTFQINNASERNPQQACQDHSKTQSMGTSSGYFSCEDSIGSLNLSDSILSSDGPKSLALDTTTVNSSLVTYQSQENHRPQVRSSYSASALPRHLSSLHLQLFGTPPSANKRTCPHGAALIASSSNRHNLHYHPHQSLDRQPSTTSVATTSSASSSLGSSLCSSSSGASSLSANGRAHSLEQSNQLSSTPVVGGEPSTGLVDHHIQGDDSTKGHSLGASFGRSNSNKSQNSVATSTGSSSNSSSGDVAEQATITPETKQTTRQQQQAIDQQPQLQAIEEADQLVSDIQAKRILFNIQYNKARIDHLNEELERRLHQYEYLVAQEKALLGSRNMMLFTNEGVNNFHLHRVSSNKF